MQLIKRNYLEIKWVQEALVFFILFILLTLNAWYNIKNFGDLLKAIAYCLVLYVHAQVHRFILVPNFFEKGRLLVYFSITVLLIFIFSLLLYFINIYWILEGVKPPGINNLQIYFYHTGTCALSLPGILAPFLMTRFYREEKKKAALQLSIKQLELKNLHSQLNPHFLFNTFNNIYGISLNEPSRGPELILQVSKLMRYQLESFTREHVDLEDELNFIETYIELEEERVGIRCDIRYEYSVLDEEYLISPLLLISFIENAFKHGTNSISGNFIYISIFVKGSVLEMEVVNSISGKLNIDNSSTGIGLKNAIQRLNILYEDAYRLSIEQDTRKYTVNLKLPLIIK